MTRQEADSGAGPPGEEPRFEDRLARLESIVEELESGTLSLEQTIACYEEGLKISRTLQRTLEEAEKRIEQLAENATGETRTPPMAAEPEEDEPRPSRPQRSRPEHAPPDRGPS